MWKENLQKLTSFARRVKYVNGPKDKFGNITCLPGKTAFGDQIRFTKQHSYVKSHVEGPLVIYGGNYEDWEIRLQQARDIYFRK